MNDSQMVALIKAAISPLVRHPEAISVSVDSTGRYRRFTVSSAKRDVGRIIGRQGHVATALRTLIEGAFPTKPGAKRVRLVINDHKH